MHRFRNFALFVVVAFAMMACRSDDFHLRVQIIVPGDVPSVESGVLRLSLYAYDQRSADGPATHLDEESATFTHKAGVEQRFWMTVAGTVPAGMTAYISVRGFESTDHGEAMILWDGITDSGTPMLVVMQPVQIYD